MDAKVWRNLPDELLERMLSFLSIRALLRLRTVCRRWNDLIHDPSFVHRATQQYLVARWTARIRDYSFLSDDGEVGENGANITENRPDITDYQGYCLLDVHSKEWYTIRSIEPLDGNDFGYTGSVAMDGGLVCYVIESEHGNSFYLTNPVLNLSRRLPPPPRSYIDTVDIKMDMAAADGTCTIFLMPAVDTLERLHPPQMVSYNTTSNQWRTADLPSLPTDQESRVACSVVFGGSLYALLIPNSDLDATEHWLWRYDASTSWSDTGIAIRGCVLADPELMASGDSRMLLAAWKQSSSGDFIYEVSEVGLERKVVEMVVSVDVERVFGVSNDVDMGMGLDLLHVVSMGESVVVVDKATGAVRIYDLRTGEWDESVPDRPAVEGLFQMWYGKAMHLNLRSSTFWIHESGDA